MLTISFARDHPLVIYAFTEDNSVQETILKSTMSGNFVFNDTFQQLASNDIPFGGVGESGSTSRPIPNPE